MVVEWQYVHESVTYTRCPDLESDAVETLVIRVTIPHAKPVAVVYRPPSAPVAWYGVFDDFIDRLCAQECELVVMGNTVEPLLYDHPQNHIGVVV